MATPLEIMKRRHEALKTERSSWITHWKAISDLMSLRKGRFPGDRQNYGRERHNAIIDNTAVLALRTMASGLMAGLTSPSRPWFRLITHDPTLMDRSGVRNWLHLVEEEMRRLFLRSNTYLQLHRTYYDLGMPGTGCIFVVADPEEILRCIVPPVGSYCLATGHNEMVDTIYREIKMTVKQLVEQFGRSRVSTTVRDQYDRGNYDQWIDVVHVVERNDDRWIGSRLARNMRWKSVYYEAAADAARKEQFLSESGFMEFPAPCPRWDVDSGEDVYGISPAMVALGDMRQLQTQQRRKGQAVEKIVNPPLVGPSSLKQRRVSLIPGDITYEDVIQGELGLRPVYTINPQLEHLLLDIEDTRARIRRTFYEDLFLMLAMSDRREITAREIEEKHEEKLIALGPVLDRLNSELLDLLIERAFSIMARAGILPPPPDALRNADIRVEYISYLAQAQQLISTAKIERQIGFTMSMASIWPEVADTVDSGHVARRMNELLGNDPAMMREEAEVQRLRRERAAMAQAQQAQQAMPALKDASTAAKNLSETSLGRRDSALDRLARASGGVGATP